MDEDYTQSIFGMDEDYTQQSDSNEFDDFFQSDVWLSLTNAKENNEDITSMYNIDTEQDEEHDTEEIEENNNRFKSPYSGEIIRDLETEQNGTYRYVAPSLAVDDARVDTYDDGNDDSTDDGNNDVNDENGVEVMNRNIQILRKEKIKKLHELLHEWDLESMANTLIGKL